MSCPSQLLALARRLGIITSYKDMEGNRQHIKPHTLHALLEIWGISARNPKDIREAVRHYSLEHWSRSLEPVSVAWQERAATVQIRLPATSIDGRLRLQLEDGSQRSFSLKGAKTQIINRAKIVGDEFVILQLTLPALPLGYHKLTLERRGQTQRSLIISAPTHTYSPTSTQKSWGLFLPMYAVHSKRSWGAGNFHDWARFGAWARSLGANVVATLPLLAAFLEAPHCDPSPYSPVSRLFWNEFYLDIESIPEFANCSVARRLVGSAGFQRELDSFRRQPLVDYPAQMAARRRVLELLAKFFFSRATPRHVEFEAFVRSRPEAEEYARFRAVCERTKLSWHRWGPRLQEGRFETSDYSEAAKNYHLYVQWLAEQQVSRLSAAPSGTTQAAGLYLDFPLGVHPDGYDLWRHRDAFAFPATVGAPSDLFFARGQNWGFAPLHPRRLREQGYSYLLQCLCFHFRHASMLRLDHVMGLHRLYWIPPGFPASEGAYVAYPAEELYAILCLESHRHQVVLVGENLGTVPRKVDAAMVRHKLRQMYVVQFSQRADTRHALPAPPLRAVASLNTHDTPTFAAHWSGLDIDSRARLGLLNQAGQRLERARRRMLNRALSLFLKKERLLSERASSTQLQTRLASPEALLESAGPVVRAVLAWLAASPAEFLLINLEDLWLETRPQNVPGTCSECPNWRRKARFSLERLEASAQFHELLRALNDLRLAPKKHPHQ